MFKYAAVIGPLIHSPRQALLFCKNKKQNSSSFFCKLSKGRGRSSFLIPPVTDARIELTMHWSWVTHWGSVLFWVIVLIFHNHLFLNSVFRLSHLPSPSTGAFCLESVSLYPFVNTAKLKQTKITTHLWIINLLSSEDFIVCTKVTVSSALLYNHVCTCVGV